MPKIIKQTPDLKAGKFSADLKVGGRERSILGSVNRIKPVGAGHGGIKLNVYGRGKTGKTRLACTFPKPLLVIGTEDGTKSIGPQEGLDFVLIKSSAEVDELADYVMNLKAGERSYASVVLDTAGGLQDMILKEILGLDELPVQRSWGMASRDSWMACGSQTRERLRKLLDLASLGINVVVIAHERNFNEEGNGEVMLPSVGSALTPSAAGWLNGAVDYVCQAFIREKEIFKETQVGGKTVKIRQAGAGCEYCLRTGPHPIYLTGFRVPPSTVLPDVIIDPSFEKIHALIRGE